MIVKEKKCKGIGKAVTVKGCGLSVLKRTFGLCQKCYVDFLLNTDKGKEVFEKARLKGKSINDKPKKPIVKSNLDRFYSNSIAKCITITRKPFHKWIRQRDKSFGCISCGSTKSAVYDAGHLYKAEVFTGLIFDEHNVHKQCRKCNFYLNGNEGEYRKGIVNRYGEQYLAEIDAKANYNRVKGWSREELWDIKTKYQKLLR